MGRECLVLDPGLFHMEEHLGTKCRRTVRTYPNQVQRYQSCHFYSGVTIPAILNIYQSQGLDFIINLLVDQRRSY